MSMGPSQKPVKVEISRFDRIHHTIKKTAELYFNNPIHYLFYSALSATIIGLFCGMNFSWQYYSIFGGITIMEGLNIFIKHYAGICSTGRRSGNSWLCRLLHVENVKQPLKTPDEVHPGKH